MLLREFKIQFPVRRRFLADKYKNQSVDCLELQKLTK